MSYAFYVWDSDGEFVDMYYEKAKAVEHAKRIGGTWTKQRL